MGSPNNWVRTVVFLVCLIIPFSARCNANQGLISIPGGPSSQYTPPASKQSYIVLYDDAAVRREAALHYGVPGAAIESEAALAYKVSQYRVIKQEVMAELAESGIVAVRDYSHLPMAVIRVSSDTALQALRAHPGVAAVYENGRNSLFLAESLPLILQPQAKVLGHGGAGATVAVLDTGTDYTNPAFGPCTSPGVPAGCKVVAEQFFAPNSSQLDFHGHGTNVSGIVLGVAPDAKVAALHVFDSTTGYAFDDDIIAAIDWCIANKSAYNIVAMNMSFGTDERNGEPITSGPYIVPFANARAAGILPVVASGNSGYSDGIATPAAVAGGISVGAVYDSNLDYTDYMVWGTTCIDKAIAADQIVCFSNGASFLTLLAPGSVITAAGLRMSGTSMAAPHAAGAAAVLRSAFPTESLDQTVGRMTYYGKPTLDNRNDVTTPRLDLFGAISGSATCIGTSLAPSNQVVSAATNTGTFSVSAPSTCAWSASTDADWVTFTAGNGTGDGVIGWSVTPNTGGTTRSATVTVGIKAVTITQIGSGPAEVFPPGATMPAGWSTPSGATNGWSVVVDAAHEGFYSLKSGHVANGQRSQIEMTSSFPEGLISFARKVSSEAGYDRLVFYIDGVERGAWSGEQGWEIASFSIGAGEHTLRWSYERDGNGRAGDDAAWIDLFSVTPRANPPECTLNATPRSIAPGGTAVLSATCSPAATSFDWTNSGFSTSSAGGSVKPGTTSVYSVAGNNAAGRGNTAKASVTVAAGPTYAYVTNWDSHSVSVIQTATSAVIATINVGAHPFEIAVNPIAKRAYVANSGDDTVSVIDTVRNVVVATIGVGTYPMNVVVNSAGTRVYVGNWFSKSVSVIDTATNAVIANIDIAVPRPTSFTIALTPDGSRAYVHGPGLLVIDTSTNAIAAHISIYGARGMAFNPEGTRLWATAPTIDTVNVLDTSTHSVVATISIKGGPGQIALSPDGRLAYVVSEENHTVSVIDTSNYSIVRTVDIPEYPFHIAVDPAGEKAYVTHGIGNMVTILDTATNTVSKAVTVGTTPMSVAVGGASAPECILTASPSAIASGEAAVLTASCNPAADSYNWSANAGFAANVNHGTVTPVATTTYSVIGSNQAGAGNTASASVKLNASPIPVCTLAPGTAVSTKFGTSRQFTASCTHTPTSYVWKVDGVIDPNATQATYVTSDRLVPGPHTISVFARNAFGPSVEIPAAPNLTVYPAQAAQYAYVADQRVNAVSVIDTASNSVIASVPVGYGSTSVAANPEGTRVYVANFSSNSVSVIGTSTNTVIASIPVPCPVGVAVNPAGTRVYATNWCSNSLTVIDSVANTIVATVPVGLHPRGAVVDRAGSHVYVTNSDDDSVSVIDAVSNVVVRAIAVGNSPGPLSINSDGTRVYVNNADDKSVSVIDAASGLVIATFDVGGGSQWGGLVLNQAGTTGYVSAPESGKISVFDASSNTMTGTIGSGTDWTFGVAINPEESRLYAPNPVQGTVLVIDVASRTIVGRVQATASPGAIALTRNGMSNAANAPLCTLSSTPTAVTSGAIVALQATCSPAATSYEWTNTGFDSSAASGTVVQNVTTTYSVRGINANGKGNTAAITVTATPPPVPACTLQPVSPIIPFGSTRSFTANCSNGPTSYRWSVDGVAVPDATTATFTTLSTLGIGSHIVTVAASNFGGTSTPVSTSAQVLQVPTCSLTATPRKIARGELSTLTASCSPAATSYLWSANTGFANSTMGGLVSPLNSTTYSVRGANAAGTSPTATATVVVQSAASRRGVNAAILLLLLD